MLSIILMRPYSYRLFFILICLMSVSITGLGQEKPLTFRIVSFRENQFDMSAANPEYQMMDGDGMPYAIIKVKSETPGDDVMQYDFNFFNMKHEKKNVKGELWIYVQRNAKNVTITRPGYAPVSQYSLNPTIEAGKNYDMVISAESKKIYKQPVRFDVTPANCGARIMVQRQIAGSKEEYFGDIGEDGSVAKNLECGRYSFKVVAKDYVTADGVLDLTYSGPAPIGPTVTEKVTLSPNFAEVTFEVDADAHIYIDGEQRGFRHFTQKLEIGHQYEVECREEGCRPTSQTITIQNASARTITLKSPTRITGYVYVSSTPLDADITIAGKNYGLTPTSFELPIGSYAIKLSKTGYKDFTSDFEVKEGETAEISGTLVSLKKDNPAKEEKPKKEKTEAPQKKDQQDKEVKENTAAAKNQISSGPKREYFRPMEFYVAPGVRIGSGMGVGIAAGARLHNVNIEVGYSLGLTKGNEVMWAQTEPTEAYVGKCAYSVDALEFKAGYQIGLGEKLALTPQVGYLGQKLSGGEWGNGAMCHNLSVGANLTYKFAPAIGVFVNPAYAVPVMVNDLYTAINEKGGPAKGGFQTRVGLEVSFGK